MKRSVDEIEDDDALEGNDALGGNDPLKADAQTERVFIDPALKEQILGYIEKCIHNASSVPSGLNGDAKLMQLGWFDFATNEYIPPALRELHHELSLFSNDLIREGNIKMMQQTGNDMDLYDMHTRVMVLLKHRLVAKFGPESVDSDQSYQIYIGRSCLAAVESGKPYAVYIGSSVHPAIKRWREHKKNKYSGASRMQEFLDENGRDVIEFSTMFSLPEEYRHPVALYWFEAFTQIAFHAVRTIHGLNCMVGQLFQVYKNDKGWMEKLLECVKTRLDTGAFRSAWLGKTVECWRTKSLSTERQQAFDTIMPTLGVRKVPFTIRSNRQWLDLILEYHNSYDCLPSIGSHEVVHENPKFQGVNRYICTIRNIEFGGGQKGVTRQGLSKEERAYVQGHHVLKGILRPTVDRKRDKFELAARTYAGYIATFRAANPTEKFPYDLEISHLVRGEYRKNKYYHRTFLVCLVKGRLPFPDEKRQWLTDLSHSDNNDIYTDMIDYIDSNQSPAELARQRVLYDKAQLREKAKKWAAKKKKLDVAITKIALE